MCVPLRASIPPLSPAGRAPGPPFTPPRPGSRRHSHRYLGCAAQRSPFSPQGQDPPAISQRSRMGPVESALLNKLCALSAKYLGSYLPSRTLLGSQRIRIHFQGSTQCLFSGLGQKDEQPLGRPTGFWTPSKHADQPSAPRTTHMPNSYPSNTYLI